VRLLLAQGFRIVATTGAHAHLSGLGLEVTPVRKVLEGSPHILDAMKNREIALVVNTPEGRPPPAPRPRPRRSPSRRRARRTCARCRATRRGDGAAA
jgi:carbamoyl-phosphate synthase large subunit